MEKYHKPIASIALQHEYYSNKNLPAATIHPFPVTQLFLKNHRMLFKRKSHFYVLLQEAEQESNSPTIPIGQDPQYLCFGINFNDTHYQLRSGLNYDPRRNKIVVETGDEDTAMVSESNIMPCLNTFREAEETVLITDRNEELVFSSDKDPRQAFDHLDTGIYKANGQAFFKHVNPLEWDAVLVFRLSESDTLIEKKVFMPAGNYYWRYKIQKKFNQHKALSIVEENERMDFTEMEAPKEDQAVFFSKEPVKLSEQALLSLSLYNNDNIIKKYLPIPELINARFLSAEEKSLVLEAYVTI
ncbi:MAG: hypothetical protein K0S33_1737 [Bacteroidetes bacterium]|jgi:hypothetical protein|nr:hypothetical protein [Bacteroidota bacterium]